MILVAISLPGNILIENLDSVISFEEVDMNVKDGGTANVVMGTLVDPDLISKYQTKVVAVKFIRSTTFQVSESFRYEVSIMSAIPESPFIVQMIGYSLKPMAIIMKKYECSLQDFLDKDQSERDAIFNLKAAREIALGMQLIHSKDIIHFDLKPGK